MPTAPTTAPTKPFDEGQLQQLIDDLQSAAGRDLPFLTKLIEAQARIAGGQSAAIFTTEGSKPPRVVAAYPLPADRRVKIDPARLKLMKDCAARCRDAAKLSLFRVGNGSEVYHAICMPLIRHGTVEGVSVIMADPRNPRNPSDGNATAGDLSGVQWVSQLYAGHVARRMLVHQLRQAGETRSAMEVLAAAHRFEKFEAVVMAVCNRLKTELRARRVSLGWVKGFATDASGGGAGSSIRLIAMSDTENIDRRQDSGQKLEAAMEECLDQGQPVVAPSGHLKGDDEWLAQAVARCHAEVIGDDGRVTVCSVPLRYQDRLIGVITVERPATDPWEGSNVAHLQATADLIAPRLHDRWNDERPLAVRAWRSARRVAGKIVGPEHVGVKLVALLAIAVVVYSSVAKWHYTVDAPFELEAGGRQVLSAPFDGFLVRVDKDKGDSVEAGELLARLDDTELQLQLSEVKGKLVEAQTQRDRAMAENKLADAKRAAAVMAQLAAQQAQLKYQIERSSLEAGEAGVVLSGEWLQKQGVRVQMGDPIFEVAPISQLRARIYVDESDIERVREGVSTGRLATLSKPGEVYEFRVTRVIPLGEPRDGRNVFEVRGELSGYNPEWRPGVQGTAKIDAGEERVIWIATHRLVDFLRLKLWW